MSDTALPLIIEKWQVKLNITHYRIQCERISPFQVSNDYFERGHEFVGISADHKSCQACLYHTRKLLTEDIVHELLHVKYPFWTEQQVNEETSRLLLKKNLRGRR